MDMIDLVAAAQHKAMRDIQFKEDMAFLKNLWKYDVMHRIKTGTCTQDDIYSAYAFILKYGWRADG